jgi:hypothetical protein
MSSDGTLVETAFGSVPPVDATKNVLAEHALDPPMPVYNVTSVRDSHMDMSVIDDAEVSPNMLGRCTRWDHPTKF